MVLAAFAETLATTEAPTGLPPLRIVNVTMPSLMVPAVLPTWALKVSVWSETPLNVAEALPTVVFVAAGLTVRKCSVSVEGR